MKTNYPIVTAHTGCMNTQDNTIESAIAGLESGADFIEVDVRSTKDNIAILAHNSFVIDYTGNIFNIYDLTLEELKKICDDNDYKLAVLDDVLSLVKAYDKRINLDLKGPFAAQAMVDSIKKNDVNEMAVITGCHYELAYYLKRIYPDLHFYLNADEGFFLDIEQFDKQSVRDALSASCIGINLEYQKCNTRLVELAKTNSLLISVWTVNEEDDMKNMIEMGVDSITTRNVPVLLNLLNKNKI